MKRFIKILLFILLILGIEVVKAETFVEGNYISGEYITKKKDGKIHYLTIQYLKDSKGNIVYCLEPYTKFVEGKSYTSYETITFYDVNGDTIAELGSEKRIN